MQTSPPLFVSETSHFETHCWIWLVMRENWVLIERTQDSASLEIGRTGRGWPGVGLTHSPFTSFASVVMSEVSPVVRAA